MRWYTAGALTLVGLGGGVFAGMQIDEERMADIRVKAERVLDMCEQLSAQHKILAEENFHLGDNLSRCRKREEKYLCPTCPDPTTDTIPTWCKSDKSQDGIFWCDLDDAPWNLPQESTGPRLQGSLSGFSLRDLHISCWSHPVAMCKLRQTPSPKYSLAIEVDAWSGAKAWK